MMRTALTLIALLVLVESAQAEEIDNPEYAQWSKFNVGATATRKMVTTVGQTKTEIEMTTTLKSKTRTKLVLTTTSVSVLNIPGQGERKFPTPAKDRDVPAKIKRTTPPAQGQGAPESEVEEGTETLDIAGKKLACKWHKATVKTGGNTVVSKTWTSSEVPGQTVKMTMKARGKVETSTELVLVSFKTP